MSGNKHNNGLARGADQILRARRSVARKLPHPEHKWEVSEVPDEIASHVYKFSQAGIVHCVRRKSVDGSTSTIWTTDKRAYEYVNNVISDPTTAGPCEHGGIRNLGDGEFTCTNDECDVRFGREIALERV